MCLRLEFFKKLRSAVMTTNQYKFSIILLFQLDFRFISDIYAFMLFLNELETFEAQFWRAQYIIMLLNSTYHADNIVDIINLLTSRLITVSNFNQARLEFINSPGMGALSNHPLL